MAGPERRGRPVWIALATAAVVLIVAGLATWAAESTKGPEGNGALLIHGTGDVSLDPTQVRAFRTKGYDWAWSGLADLFRDDDLTVINLECPATDVVAPVPKTFVFRCDPDALPVARGWGIDVANLANNHSYDQGREGLVDSMRNLRAAGIDPVGAGGDRDQALDPAILDVDGWRIAVVGLTEAIDAAREVARSSKPGTAAVRDVALALRVIRAAASEADLVIVTIHWGIELDNQPRRYQVTQAHRMIDAGADVIFGHHAHRLQPMETYQGRPIFYGLGNFVWPRLTTEDAMTAVAEVRIRPDGSLDGRLLPAVIESDGHPVLR